MAYNEYKMYQRYEKYGKNMVKGRKCHIKKRQTIIFY